MTEKTASAKANMHYSKIMTILVKISGDLQNNEEALKFIRTVGEGQGVAEFLVAVIVGGRTQVSEALEWAGYKLLFHDNGRRKHRDWMSNSIAATTLARGADVLRGQLQDTPLRKYVLKSPFWAAGHISAHMDADDLLRVMYHNFHEAYCLTVKGRKKDLPAAIKVVEF